VAWRFRRALRAGWLRLNLSRGGIGWSVGPRFARLGVSANGRKYVSCGIPGTGLYFFRYLDYGRTRHLPRSASQSPSGPMASTFSTLRVRCVLIVDFSASVAGSPGEQLNDSLAALPGRLRSLAPACSYVELALFTFGDVELASNFAPTEAFNPPKLLAGGSPNVGRAIARGLACAAQPNAAPEGRTLVFLVTNSPLSGSLSALSSRVEAGERNREFAFFAVGLDSADLQQLAKVAMRTPLRVKEANIEEFFAWLSRTLVGLARTRPGEEMLLEPPLWAQ